MDRRAAALRCGCEEDGEEGATRVTARVLDGNVVAAQIRGEVAPGVAAFTARAGRPPTLGIVLVGSDPASEIYVRNKVRAGTESGLTVDLQRLGTGASLSELLVLVHR